MPIKLHDTIIDRISRLPCHMCGGLETHEHYPIWTMLYIISSLTSSDYKDRAYYNYSLVFTCEVYGAPK